MYQLTNQIRPHAKPGTQRQLYSSSFYWPNRIINRAKKPLRKQSLGGLLQEIDLLLHYFECDHPSLPLLSLSHSRSRQKIVSDADLPATSGVSSRLVPDSCPRGRQRRQRRRRDSHRNRPGNYLLMVSMRSVIL